MKKYLNFIKEDLEKVKDDIVKNIEKTSKEEIDIEDKKHDDLDDNFREQLEKLETQKDLIKKKLEIFNAELENSTDEEQIKNIEKSIEDLGLEIEKFDELITNAREQNDKLNDNK